MEVFKNLETNLIIYSTLRITSCATERNFPKLRIIEKNSMNLATGKTALSFYCLNRKCHYIIVI